MTDSDSELELDDVRLRLELAAMPRSLYVKPGSVTTADLRALLDALEEMEKDYLREKEVADRWRGAVTELGGYADDVEWRPDELITVARGTGVADKRVRLALALCRVEQVALHDTGALVPADVINYALAPETFERPDSWDAWMAEISEVETSE